MKRVLPVMLAAGCLAIAGCTHMAQARFNEHVKNKPAADFELRALDGNKVRLSDFRGKPVVLAFWAYG